MASKDQMIADLGSLVEKQAKQIATLAKELDEVKLQLAKAKKNSTNSSMRPSSDITKPKKSKGKSKPGRPKKRKSGGQPGHQRKLREPLPKERVNKTVDHVSMTLKSTASLSLDRVCWPWWAG